MADERKVETEKGAGSDGLYTLTQIAEKTDISMPTLQRYKKNYQNRIPSVGKGRKQRYPAEAIPVFEQIKEENLQRRGRPPKTEGAKRKAGRPRGKKAPARGKKKEGLLTLTAVAEEAGVSYPTAVRYVKEYGDQIPYEGKGRSRRYHPEAIEVVKRLRAESPRGRRPKAAAGASRPGRPKAAAAPAAGGGDLAKRVASLERTQADLAKRIQELIKEIRKPMKLTINR